MSLEQLISKIHSDHPEYIYSIYDDPHKEVVFFNGLGLPIAVLELKLETGSANLFEYKDKLKG